MSRIRSVTDVRRLCRRAFFDQVDHGALGVGLARAMLDGSSQQLLHFRKISELGPNLFQMVLGNLAHLVAESFPWAAEREDCPDLLGGEPEVACTTDEIECSNMPFVVDAVSALGSSWYCEDADVLEVADRFDVDPGATGQLAAGDPFGIRRRHVDFP